MTFHEADLIVVGGGPAGMAAAAQGAELGLSVILIDDGEQPGGQVYRAEATGMYSKSGVHTAANKTAGMRLREALFKCGTRVLSKRTLWSIEPGYTAHLIGPNGPETVSAPRVVIASGAYERQIPFPGWTNPEVIGLAAATILLKSQHTLPGKRIAIAGAGPLIYAVAAEAISLGGEIVAIADLSSRLTWASEVPKLFTSPRLLSQGAAWMAKIKASGTPIYFSHRISEAQYTGKNITALLSPVNSEGELVDGQRKSVNVDTICIGSGLVPATELVMLAGAEMRYAASEGGWVPVRDTEMRLSLPGLYAAGDGTGILGAIPSEIEGRLAAATAAKDAGISEGAAHSIARAMRRKLAWKKMAGRAAARLMAIKPKMAKDIPGDCIVCRCEDVHRYDIEAAIDNGAKDVNQVKAWTRCGMGPCQGRMCRESAAEIIASRVGSREAVGVWTSRAPLKPINVSELIGDYSYQDIPMPKSAPL
nr:NAD(P)/FAD-dependent oxidoreductase [Halomonas socia]